MKGAKPSNFRASSIAAQSDLETAADYLDRSSPTSVDRPAIERVAAWLRSRIERRRANAANLSTARRLGVSYAEGRIHRMEGKSE